MKYFGLFLSARHCSSSSSPCGTPSSPTPGHPEGHPCACARICGLTPLYSCRAFQVSCMCNYNTDGAHSRTHPFSPPDCCHCDHHHHYHHRGQHNGPSRFTRPSHTASCQEGINPHYNNSYFNARDGPSATTNQTDSCQPSNPNSKFSFFRPKAVGFLCLKNWPMKWCTKVGVRYSVNE